MKQGSTDDPFADDATAEESSQNQLVEDNSPTEPTEDATTAEPESVQGSHSRSLPYIHSRDGVKDGRTQRPVFLRDRIEDGISELVTQMEAEFGEDVYKTDVTEAAMAVAQENPQLVREKLDAWGYGWD